MTLSNSRDEATPLERTPAPSQSTRPDHLGELIREQLTALSRLSGLPADVDRNLHSVFDLLTAESLSQAIDGPFAGLSRINADGLPFQWVLRARKSAVDFGFLCEVGTPGDTPQRRCALSRVRLASASTICASTNDWLDAVADILVPRSPEEWPSHWRSALWVGVVPAPQGILLKPYFNLNFGSARDRWLRAGHVLQALGRNVSLASLCSVSSAVSQDSWPVGLTVDVLPDGLPGRVKVYFRSDGVTLEWLRCWYEATGHTEHVGLARRFLDLFPMIQQHRYPEAAFTVGLEFHPASAGLGLKTDLAVTKWIASDGDICRAAKTMAEEVGLRTDWLEERLEVIGAIPANSSAARSFRFVGLGHEPDGSSHLNVYLEPRPRPSRELHARRARSVREAIRAASSFLCDARCGDCWLDYELPVGTSNAWVTAYTLAKLATVHRDLLPEDATRVIRQALDWLVSVCSRDGGWGFNLTVPNDADSTAWAILALRRQNRPIPESARHFLSLCREAKGSFTTYPRSRSTPNLWMAAAPDVSAAAMAALEEQWNPTVESFLSQWWTPDCTLPAYWWTSPFYTLSLLLEAFPEFAASPAGQSTIVTLDKATPASSFDAALLLVSLVLLNRPRAAAVASELRHLQRVDGSWPSSAVLRLPTPEMERPWDAIDSRRLFRDQNAVFTTATAVAALSLFLARSVEQGGTLPAWRQSRPPRALTNQDTLPPRAGARAQPEA